MQFCNTLFWRFRKSTVPGALLMLLLQRTPALSVVAASEEILIASPVGTVLKSVVAAVVALGGLHTLAGASELNVSAGTSSGITVQSGSPMSVSFSLPGSDNTPFPTAKWTLGIAAGSSFPPGLNFSGLMAAGTANTKFPQLSGTATSAGVYHLTLQAFSAGNEYASEMYNYAVTVNAANTAPSFSMQPVSQSVTAGNGVTFTATANGTPAPTYQWRKDNNDIPGATSNSFMIVSVSAGDAGSYTVVATNIVSSVTSNAATLTVNPANTAPAFSVHPQSQTVTAGNPVTFTAAASGTPTPTYQWQKNGSPIGGATGSSYTIVSTVVGDAGSYTVVATNSVSSVTSNTATLTVNPATVAPSITLQPISQTATVGSFVTFTATASGTPTPTYQWQKNNQNINGATTSSYSIASVTTSDAGSYAVIASNTAGSTPSNTVTLTVNKANPTLTWGSPLPIDLGTALSATQLNATANVPGTFVYTPAAGAVPAAGSDMLSVAFTPTDSANYNQVSTNQTIVVVTQATFLRRLFNHLLQREPTTSELIDDGAVLAAGGTRTDVFVALLNSATYQARDVESVIRLYFATFNRMPDYPGLLSWSETLRTGASNLVNVGSAFAGSAEFLSTYGSLDNTQFVQQLYRNVLGREADPDGLAIWVATLNAGAVRGEILTGFSESTEFQANTAERIEIIRLHALLFGRMPTGTELTSWIGFLHGDDQSSIFLDSTEFLALFPGGGTNDQFVQTAFRGILRRNADPGAIANFSPALTAGTMTRAQLIALLFNSGEAQSSALPVTRLYLASLRRGPDGAGLDVWTTYVNSGNTLLALSEGISSSPEFLARYGNLTNQAYVEALYLGVLGRISDPAGLAYWTSQLDTNASSRAEILIGFAQSAESINLFDADVRTTLLSLALYDRLPTAPELALWHDYFATLPQQLREEFLESTEFNGEP